MYFGSLNSYSLPNTLRYYQPKKHVQIHALKIHLKYSIPSRQLKHAIFNVLWFGTD